MKLTTIKEDFLCESGVPRSKGLHLTTIIYDLLTVLREQKHHDLPITELQAQFEKGFIWERVLSRAFGERTALRPGEVECDGITGSPDGLNFITIHTNGTISYDGDTMVIEEYKCTNYSSNKTPDMMLGWIMQVEGYCHMMQLTACLFRVLYLQGDYSTNRNPQSRVYFLQFGETELEENWRIITNHAKSKGWL